MAKRKAKRKFGRKLAIWITDRPLHDVAKKHAKAAGRSLSAVTQDALREYLGTSIAGAEMVHRSIVIDLPGRPVAAPCALGGCQFGDLVSAEAMTPAEYLGSFTPAAQAVRAADGPAVDERVAAVKASAQRMARKHAGSLEKLGRPALAGQDHVAALTEKPVVTQPQQEFCRRSECKHARALHLPRGKSGQLACQLALCPCARYMA